MANRTKSKRNQKILFLWDNGKGWRQKSIARMFKMKESAVSMIICRARAKATPAKAVVNTEGAV
jgi:transcriptional regulator